VPSSKRLAGLIGPTIIALSTSEALNFHIWTTNIPAVTYLNGTLLFIAGVSILRDHHRWKGWPVLITLAGWVATLGGLYRMFAPEARQAPQTATSIAGVLALGTIGVFLTFKAYVSKSE
jgi:hypothetical protein